MRRPQNKPTPPLTEGMLHAFLRTWSRLRQIQDPYFARFGISASQWGILRVLQRAEGKGERRVSLKTVSERILVQPPSVTGVVDRLERDGFVRRDACSNDLRVRYVSLTPRGRHLMHRVLTGHANHIASLFSILAPGEQQLMMELLQRVERHLDGFLSSEDQAGPRRRGRPPRPSTD